MYQEFDLYFFYQKVLELCLDSRYSAILHCGCKYWVEGCATPSKIKDCHNEIHLLVTFLC